MTNELVALATEEADDEPTQVVDVAALARRAAAQDRAATPSAVVVRCRAVVRERVSPASCCGSSTTCSTTRRSSIRRRRRSRSSSGPGRITVRDHGAGVEPRGPGPDLRPLLPGAGRAGAAGLGARSGDRQRRRPPARGDDRRRQPPGRRGAHHDLAAERGPRGDRPDGRTAGHRGRRDAADVSPNAYLNPIARLRGRPKTL